MRALAQARSDFRALVRRAGKKRSRHLPTPWPRRVKRAIKHTGRIWVTSFTSPRYLLSLSRATAIARALSDFSNGAPSTSGTSDPSTSSSSASRAGRLRFARLSSRTDKRAFLTRSQCLSATLRWL